MKKLLYILFLGLLAVSCDMDEERHEIEKKRRLYVPKMELYDSVDSTYSNISYYVNVIDGHKFVVYQFNDKYRGNIQVIHDSTICEKCKTIK